MQDNTSIDERYTIANNPNRMTKIGRLLLQLGKITYDDTEKILELQQEKGILFGDAAMELGLINSDDIQQVVAMQFNYHYLQAGQSNCSRDLVAAYEPFSEEVESFRALRSQLMMRWFKLGHRTLAFVSPNSGDGVSYLISNLAVVFSQLGAKTLLIDANMRQPSQQKIFNVQHPIGLSDIIVGRGGMNAVRPVETIQDLYLLTAGTVPPNPQELLGRASFSYLMKIVSETYDVVLVDTPPILESADAHAVVEQTGGAMIVSKLNQTKVDDVAKIRSQLEVTGAEIVGAIINEF